MAHLARAFEQLRVGDSFVTDARTVSEADVLAFAAQTGDVQPAHVDVEGARSSLFGERVAHGMLTLSYALGLLRLDPCYALALRRVGNAVFARPVKLGDTIRVDGKVTALTPCGDESAVVTLKLHVRNQHDRVACRASIELSWVRESAGVSPRRESRHREERTEDE